MNIYREDVKIVTEMRYICHILAIVGKKWAEIDEYLAALVSEDFMKTKEYYKLLFDDENLTRSCKYFWVIGCLNEFIISIGDNITQSREFHDNILKPLLANPHFLESLDSVTIGPIKGGEGRVC